MGSTPTRGTISLNFTVMFRQQLVDYIREQVRQGKGKEEIKKSLLEQKWSEADIEESFGHATMSSLEAPPAPPHSSLLSATKTFSQAWKLFRERLGTLAGITLVSILFVLILAAIGVGIGLAAGISLYSLPAFALSNLVTMSILAVLGAIIFSLLSIWSQAAVMYALKDAHEKIGVVESYRRSWSTLLSYWWVLILAGLITTGGFLLLVIPGIIFSVWFSLAGFIIINEGEKGLRALFKSREYVRGYWWKVLWNFIFIGLVYLLATLALELIGLLPIPDIILSILDFILQIFLPALSAAFVFSVYQNLKATKDKVTVEVSGGRKTWFTVICIVPLLLVLLFIPFITRMTSLFRNFSEQANEINFIEDGDYSPLLDSSIGKTKDAQRLSDIKQIQTALELYYTDHSEYPAGTNISLGDTEHACLNDTGFGKTDCAAPYMAFVPKGPEADEYYLYDGEGGTYRIMTDLWVGAGGFEAGTIIATPEGITNF